MSEDEVFQIQAQAQALLEIGRSSEAAALLTRGLSLAPHDYGLLCNMAQASLDLGQAKEALRYVERALASVPDDSWGHRLRSTILRRPNRHESLKSAQEATRLEPDDPANWHNLVASHLQVFNLKEARAAAEHLRKLAPDWYLTYHSIALVALAEGNHAEAEALCREELRLNPDSYYAMNNLGVALLDQGRKREAVDSFNRAAKMNPDAEVARQNLQVAVAKYLPRIGISVGVLIGAGQLARVLGTFDGLPRILAVIPLALLALFLLGALIVHTKRSRSLPTEVKTYLKLRAQPPKRNWKREWLIVACVITGVLSGIYLLVILDHWRTGEIKANISELWITLLLLLSFVASVVLLRRIPKDVDT